jgi:hypothetical protein
MIEIALLASIIGIIGMLIRAALENESSKFCLFHAVSIGILAGLFAFFYFDIPYPLTISGYIILTVFFLMFGYGGSDVLDSVIFIIRHPTCVIKLLIWILYSIQRILERLI